MSPLRRQVFFVVGNHDLWTARRKQNAAGTDEEEDGGSVQKLMQVHQTCEVRSVTLPCSSRYPVAFV